PEAAALPDLDKLAAEFGVNLAVESKRDPKPLMASLGTRSKRIGISADLGSWMENGVKPVDAVPVIKDRLLAITVRGRDRAPLADLYLAACRAGVKPLFIGLAGTGAADTFADLQKAVAIFERAMIPTMTARVRQVVDSPQGQIRGPALLSADMKQKIDDAAPRQVLANPKKPRKLLVTDLQMYAGHGTIPHGNLMLELMAKYTGAFQ